MPHRRDPLDFSTSHPVNLRQRIPFVIVLILFTGSWCAAAPGDDDDVLKTLRHDHPRLMLPAGGFAKVKQAIQTDPLAKAYHDKLAAEAEKMLKAPPIEHVLIGPRLLDKSRKALDRVSTLAALYRIDGDKRFAERARKEMLVACAFPDWNPSHFLDVAEMTNAMALGYDWLFDYLSPDDRTAVRRAIVEKGLKQSLDIYEKHRWWSAVHHNWNQVCNGGMTVGALAIADEEPALAAKIIRYGRDSIPLAMSSFAPDGGWAEGPGYWNYATRYNVFYLAALRTALGTDFALEKSPGFAETGNFRIAFVGPTGLTFNYADAHPPPGTAPQMFWLARTFDRPAYDANERKMAAAKPDIFHLLWFNPQFSNASAGEALDKLPLSTRFKGIDVAFLRSDRRDADATFVGFKGGDNKANHSHLDLGTFVLDALGQRWAEDLGGDYYNLPGYFGNKRWTYYRLRTEGHNTLTLDAENQRTAAKAPLIAFSASGENASAVADLTDGYKGKATKVERGIAVTGRSQVLVEDEIDANQPVDIVWNFHTSAELKIDGASATLKQGSAELHARIVSPEGAKFEIVSANPEPPQGQQPNVKNLVIKLPGKTGQTRIVVAFTPGGGAVQGGVKPLAQWPGADGRPE